MTSHDVLTKARELLSDKKKWTRGVIAVRKRYSAFVPCDPDNPAACQWCATGALYKFDISCDTDAINEMRTACIARHGYSIQTTNDLLGWEAILDCFDVAIVAALQKEMPLLGHHSE